MWKKARAVLKKNSGFTLVELLVTIFIVAFVLASVAGAFSESAKVQGVSADVTRAHAEAQKYMESLYGKTYTAILPMKCTRTLTNGYYLSFGYKPQGVSESATTANVSYVHIIFTATGACYIVTPDGQYKAAGTVYNITVNATSSAWSVNWDGTVKTGTGYSKTVVIVNAMKSAVSSSITLTGSGISYILYCTKDDTTSDDKISGGTNNTVYMGTSKADRSLLRTTVDVYEDSAGTNKLASIENMLQVNNW